MALAVYRYRRSSVGRAPRALKIARSVTGLRLAFPSNCRRNHVKSLGIIDRMARVFSMMSLGRREGSRDSSSLVELTSTSLSSMCVDYLFARTHGIYRRQLKAVVSYLLTSHLSLPSSLSAPCLFRASPSFWNPAASGTGASQFPSLDSSIKWLLSQPF